MGLLVVSEAAARFFAFLFFVLAARELDPDGFGIARYTIVVATLLYYSATNVIAISLNRELGAARATDRNAEVLGTWLAVGAVLCVVICGIAAAVSTLGLAPSADPLGLVVVTAGFFFFETYYAIAKGVGSIKRAAWTYAGARVAQFVTFVVLVVVADPTPQVALLVFGLSSIVPILGAEAFRPIVRGQELRVTRAALNRLWALSRPLVIAVLAYTMWSSAPELWIEKVLGAADVGLYGAANNLSQALVVLPSGVVGFLIPRVAELRSAGRDREAALLVGRAFCGVMALSALIAATMIILRTPLLEGVYGGAYSAGAASLAGICIAMTLRAGFVVLTASAIAWGCPGVYALAIGLTAVLEIALLTGVGIATPAAAAWMSAYSIGTGLCIVLAFAWRTRKQAMHGDSLAAVGPQI